MKRMISKILSISTVLLLSALDSNAQAVESFSSVMERVQNKTWTGTFSFNVPVSCTGDIQVEFFDMRPEEFSNGIKSLSYYHKAKFPETGDLICTVIAPRVSVTDIQGCENSFEFRYSRLEGKNVAYRTMVPSADYAGVISSPSCENGQIKRSNLNLERLEITHDGRLHITARARILGLSVRLFYNLISVE